MKFWWFMFFCNMLYSLLMIIGGWFMWKHTPKKINSAAGYKSRRSQINIDTWNFANKNCGKRWWKIGWLMFVPTLIIQIPFYGQNDDTVGGLAFFIGVVECAVLLLSIIPTEKALKENYTDDGKRK